MTTDPIDTPSDEDVMRRFDLYGALWLLCSRYHSGQSSRGYRILSRLSQADYNPSPFLSPDNFESDEQREIYLTLAARYRWTL